MNKSRSFPPLQYKPLPSYSQHPNPTVGRSTTRIHIPQDATRRQKVTKQLIVVVLHWQCVCLAMKMLQKILHLPRNSLYARLSAYSNHNFFRVNNLPQLIIDPCMKESKLPMTTTRPPSTLFNPNTRTMITFSASGFTPSATNPRPVRECGSEDLAVTTSKS